MIKMLVLNVSWKKQNMNYYLQKHHNNVKALPGENA